MNVPADTLLMWECTRDWLAFEASKAYAESNLPRMDEIDRRIQNLSREISKFQERSSDGN